MASAVRYGKRSCFVVSKRLFDSRRQRRALDPGTEFHQELGDAALDLVDIRDDADGVSRTARHEAPSIAPRPAPRTLVYDV
jgi:hypothetical protein